MARVNGRRLSEANRKEIREILHHTAAEVKLRSKTKLSIRHLFVAGLKPRTMALFFCWICTMVTMYALILNVESLSGDVFVNFVLGSLMDVPAQLAVMLVVDKMGE